MPDQHMERADSKVNAACIKQKATFCWQSEVAVADQLLESQGTLGRGALQQM